MRAVSTVLDVALFLLLVGAAIAAVTAPVPGTGPAVDRQQAANTAGILTTTTASVSYTLVPESGTRAENPEFDRHAHGTVARLLAAGALGGLAVDGTRVSHARDGYRRAVADATEEAVRMQGRNLQVRAAWRPYPGASMEGRQVVGAVPPAGTAVQSTTVRVPSGVPSAATGASAAAREDGYAGVARVAADAVVSGLFPSNATRHALAGDYPLVALVRHRYARIGDLLGARVAPEKPADVARANRRLERRLAERFERELRAKFDSPERAATSLETSTVRITVRAWSS